MVKGHANLKVNNMDQEGFRNLDPSYRMQEMKP